MSKRDWAITKVWLLVDQHHKLPGFEAVKLLKAERSRARRIVRAVQAEFISTEIKLTCDYILRRLQ